MDFEEDRMALEAYIREKTLWRDEDEVSEEEWAHYAREYMLANPIDAEASFVGNEGIIYQRWSGEFIPVRTMRFIPFYWERGQFLQDMKANAEYWADYWFVGTIFRFLHWRFWFEYVGLAAPRRHFPPHFARVDD